MNRIGKPEQRAGRFLTEEQEDRDVNLRPSLTAALGFPPFFLQEKLLIIMVVIVTYKEKIHRYVFQISFHLE